MTRFTQPTGGRKSVSNSYLSIPFVNALMQTVSMTYLLDAWMCPPPSSTTRYRAPLAVIHGTGATGSAYASHATTAKLIEKI